MIRFLKTAKGFSLPEVMIAVAISGVVALGASKIMSDNYKNQAYIETVAEINKTMALAKTVLSKPDVCSEFFKMHYLFRSSDFVSGVHVNFLAVRPNPTEIKNILVRGENYGKFSVSDIVIKNSPQNDRVKDIIFTFDWKNRPFMSTALITKTVSVFTEYLRAPDGIDRPGDLLRCGVLVEDSKQESQKALCESLGTDFAVWGSPIAEKCNIKSFQCPAGEVPYTVTSLGSVICKPTQDSFDPYALIDGAPVDCPASAPNIKIIFDGSRYQLQCSGGSCTPATTCAVLRAADCPALPDTTDSCGTPCGTGTKSSGCMCTPTTTCAVLRANDCPAAPNVSDSCGVDCGPGTKSSGCTTPLANGTPCTFDLFLADNCSDCATVPTSTISKCCRPGNPASHFIYQCGGTSMNACAVEDSPNPTSLEVPTTGPGPGPPYTYDCDS